MLLPRNPLTGLAAGLRCFTFLSVLSLASADVLFTQPVPNANVTAGTINVAWKNSGSAPSLQDLTQYTLDLMVGGNDAGDMLQLDTFVAGGSFGSNGDQDQAQGSIASGIAGSVENGFFFRMTSTLQTGGTIVNYSSRFSITGLTGTTPAQYRDAAEALNGSTAGPPTSGNGVVSVTSSSVTSLPSTTLATSITQSPTTSSPTTTASTTPMHGPAPSGLPQSTEIGIIIAIAAALVIVSGVGMYFLLRWRQRKQSGIIPLGTNPFLDSPTELPAHELKPQSAHSNHSTATELYARSEVFEIGDGVPRPELDHTAVRAELPG